MAAQRLRALQIQFSPGSLNIRFGYLLPHIHPSSVIGEAERLSVQSAPYTTWWRLLAAQLVFFDDARANRRSCIRTDSRDGRTLPTTVGGGRRPKKSPAVASGAEFGTSTMQPAEASRPDLTA